MAKGQTEERKEALEKIAGDQLIAKTEADKQTKLDVTVLDAKGTFSHLYYLNDPANTTNSGRPQNAFRVSDNI
jgi:hypothetical protein